MTGSQGREQTAFPPSHSTCRAAFPAAEAAEGGSCGYRWQKGGQPGPRLQGDKCTAQRCQMDAPAFGTEAPQETLGCLSYPGSLQAPSFTSFSQMINLACQESWLP